MDKRVYIVIVNYKTWQDSIACLESILKSTYTNYQIILIDNKSPNDSVQKIKNWFSLNELSFSNQKYSQDCELSTFYSFYNETEFEGIHINQIKSKITLIESNQNKGFASGNNIFIKKLTATNAFIWMLNPDMVIMDNTLDNLVKFALTVDQRTIIGSTVKSYAKPDETLNLGSGRVNFFTGTVKMAETKQDLAKIDYISGGSLFTHSAAFKDIGLMREDYFLYWEETEWCFRAKQNKYLLKVCQESIVYDKISTSIGKGFLAEYYYSLNALRFIKQYNNTIIPFVLLSNVFRILKRLLLLKINRAKAIFKASFFFILKAH